MFQYNKEEKGEKSTKLSFVGASQALLSTNVELNSHRVSWRDEIVDVAEQNFHDTVDSHAFLAGDITQRSFNLFAGLLTSLIFSLVSLAFVVWMMCCRQG